MTKIIFGSNSNPIYEKYLKEIENIQTKKEAQIIGKKLLQDNELLKDGLEYHDQIDLISVFKDRIKELAIKEEGIEWIKLLRLLGEKWWTVYGMLDN